MARRFSKRTGTLAAVLAVAVLAAACSSEDTVVTESASEPAATTAAVETPTTTAAAEQAVIDRDDAVEALLGMVAVSGGTGGLFSDDEMRCWAEATVDAVGLEAFSGLETLDPATLAGSGVEISGAEAMQDQDMWASCIDGRERLRQLLTEGMGTEVGDCVADAAAEELAYEVAVAPFLFDQPLSPETEAAYYQLLADCEVEGLG